MIGTSGASDNSDTLFRHPESLAGGIVVEANNQSSFDPAEEHVPGEALRSRVEAIKRQAADRGMDVRSPVCRECGNPLPDASPFCWMCGASRDQLSDLRVDSDWLHQGPELVTVNQKIAKDQPRFPVDRLPVDRLPVDRPRALSPVEQRTHPVSRLDRAEIAKCNGVSLGRAIGVLVLLFAISTLCYSERNNFTSFVAFVKSVAAVRH